ncbi:MAG: trypsin-like serine peptidase, partial [Trebonia sp.]
PARTTARAAAVTAARNAWLDGDSDGRGLRWIHGGAVERTTGKVFFTLDGTDYVCSGTAIRSPRADVVLTAAHCVGGNDGDWAANWTFVPGYQDGSQPYGAFTARRFFVSPHWAGAARDTPEAEEYDIAFVTVNPASSSDPAVPSDAATASAPAVPSGPADQSAGAGPSGGAGDPPDARLPAGQPIAFTSAPTANTRAYVFGYPAEPPFTGMYSNYCAGPTTQVPVEGTAALRCDMTAGDSGGPWLAGFDPRTGTGTVVAVTTFKYSGDSSSLYGTGLGPVAKELYDEASGVANS